MKRGMPSAECGTTGAGYRVPAAASFCLLASAICILAADGPVNPDDPAYLRRQYAWFQAQDPARQQQLRKLHNDFQQFPPEDQARLTKVMQAYNAWLAKLPEADRQRVLAAPSAAERLEEVKRLREREWVEALPKPYRDEYATLDADARRQKVQEWRAEEAERHDEWAVAQKHWADDPPGKVPAVFQNDRPAIETFVARLRENLTDAERKTLDDARAAMEDYGNYFAYGFEIARLADLHPLLPWSRVGPKEWKDLPEEVRTYLATNDRHFRAKKLGFPAGEELRDVRRAQGRWPDFGVELAAYCKKNNLNLPAPLGDCRKDQMPPDVVAFLDKLEAQLKRSGDGKADLKALEEAQGKWPEYPRLLVETARKHKQAVPGWTLPGPPQFWDRLRAVKGKGK
jgi:hypothetical protein